MGNTTFYLDYGKAGLSIWFIEGIYAIYTLYERCIYAIPIVYLAGIDYIRLLLWRSSFMDAKGIMLLNSYL